MKYSRQFFFDIFYGKFTFSFLFTIISFSFTISAFRFLRKKYNFLIISSKQFSVHIYQMNTIFLLFCIYFSYLSMSFLISCTSRSQMQSLCVLGQTCMHVRLALLCKNIKIMEQTVHFQCNSIRSISGIRIAAVSLVSICLAACFCMAHDLPFSLAFLVWC